jgi:hypothetical protein
MKPPKRLFPKRRNPRPDWETDFIDPKVVPKALEKLRGSLDLLKMYQVTLVDGRVWAASGAECIAIAEAFVSLFNMPDGHENGEIRAAATARFNRACGKPHLGASSIDPDSLQAILALMGFAPNLVDVA